MSAALDRTTVLVSVNAVAGYFAMWAVRQCPFGVPDDLNIRVRALRGHLSHRFTVGEPDFKCEYFDCYSELEDVLRELMSDEIPHWNRPYSGHNSPFGFVSRFFKPKPEDDFIDLDALFRNVAMSAFAESERESWALRP